MSHDMWSTPQEWDSEQARISGLILDQRATARDQVYLRAALIEMADIGPGQTAVEVGCGTGVLLAELGQAVGAGGRVIGIEPQSHLAQAARARLSAHGVAVWTEVRTGRAEALKLSDSIADLCVAQTVFLHLPSEAGRRALAQMIRVTKPGGRVLVVDQDMSTFVVHHPDTELTNRMLQANLRHYERPAMGRQARAHLLDAGLQDVQVRVFVQAETDANAFLAGSAERMARGVAALGVITTEEMERWLQQLGAMVAADRFFASLNYYACIGTKSYEVASDAP